MAASIAILFNPVLPGFPVAERQSRVDHSAFNQPLRPGRIDEKLLEHALIYHTNLVRQTHELGICRPDEILRVAAIGHSEELSRRGLLSHESRKKTSRTLEDRLRSAGMDLGNTVMGENLGVDYYLRIADVPFYTQSIGGKIRYIDARTEKPIPYQTYRSFAERMVRNWLNSPGHRENLLNSRFDRIGIGIASGPFRKFQALYVTQNFIGPIPPHELESRRR